MCNYVMTDMPVPAIFHHNVQLVLAINRAHKCMVWFDELFVLQIEHCMVLTTAFICGGLIRGTETLDRNKLPCEFLSLQPCQVYVCKRSASDWNAVDKHKVLVVRKIG